METKFIVEIIIVLIFLAVVLFFVYETFIAKSPAVVNAWLYLFRITVGQLTNSCTSITSQSACSTHTDFTGQLDCHWCGGPNNPNELQVCMSLTEYNTNGCPAAG